MADAIMREIDEAHDRAIMRVELDGIIYDYWPDQADYPTREDAVAEVADMVREAEVKWNQLASEPLSPGLAHAADQLRDRAMRLGELSGMRKVLTTLRWAR